MATFCPGRTPKWKSRLRSPPNYGDAGGPSGRHGPPDRWWRGGTRPLPSKIAIQSQAMPADTGYNTHPELPELYDNIPLYNTRSDVDFYVDLCRQAGEALELGCGTGRVLIPAAEAGCVVTGLDQSNIMLARCRAKSDALSVDTRRRITLVEADITRFSLPKTFKLAIAPFRPIQHLTTVGEQLSFLQCVRDHLEPGGRLVFDVFNPNPALLAAEVNPEEIEDTPDLSLTDGRRVRRTYRVVRKNRAEQCNDIELIYYLDGRRIVQSSRLRYFFRFEMEHLLARSGFEVTALYGAFDRTPFVDGSPEMIFTVTPIS
jgi:SAM-dependent methyltransferase